MNVTYLIRFAVRQGERERFLGLLNKLLDAMREEPMFVDATLHVDPANEHLFFLHETWRDHQDVLDVQLKRHYRDEWHRALPDLLEGDRDVSMWIPLRSD